MNKLYSVLFLVVFNYSCNQIVNRGKPDQEDEIHDLINQTILEQYRKRGLTILGYSDSFFIDRILIDPFANSGFSVDTFNTDLYIFGNTNSRTRWPYDLYFTPADLEVVKAQIAQNEPFRWDHKQLPYAVFSDSTFLSDTSKQYPNLDIWGLFADSSESYFSVSKPIYNRNHDVALVTTELYVDDYYLSSLIEFNKDFKDIWLIESKRLVAQKIIESYQAEEDNWLYGIVHFGQFEIYNRSIESLSEQSKKASTQQ